MIGLSVLKDASEVVHYRDPQFPLYANIGHLSAFSNMEMMCHWHEDIEYIKAVKGHMTYCVNGEKVALKEGEAIIINSKQLHYGYSEDGSDCEYICVLFRPQLISGNSSVIKKYITPVTESCAIAVSGPGTLNQSPLIGLFDKIFQVFCKQEPCYEIKASGILCEIWLEWYELIGAEVVKNESGGDSNNTDINVQKNMVEYIYNNYPSRVSLKDIAAAGGVCESKCCRIFRNNLNKTPVEFLNAYRLEISMNLLRSTGFNITEIAYSCGFGGSSYYSELFMKYKGCTPREYRALQKSG